MLPVSARSRFACVSLLLYAHPTSPADLAAATAGAASAGAEPVDAAGQLHIGDFVLGDGDCASLTGHPDIRY